MPHFISISYNGKSLFFFWAYDLFLGGDSEARRGGGQLLYHKISSELEFASTNFNLCTHRVASQYKKIIQKLEQSVPAVLSEEG